MNGAGTRHELSVLLKLHLLTLNRLYLLSHSTRCRAAGETAYMPAPHFSNSAYGGGRVLHGALRDLNGLGDLLSGRRMVPPHGAILVALARKHSPADAQRREGLALTVCGSISGAWNDNMNAAES
jgi:hypothetical protein